MYRIDGDCLLLNSTGASKLTKLSIMFDKSFCALRGFSSCAWLVKTNETKKATVGFGLRRRGAQSRQKAHCTTSTRRQSVVFWRVWKRIQMNGSVPQKLPLNLNHKRGVVGGVGWTRCDEKEFRWESVRRRSESCIPWWVELGDALVRAFWALKCERRKGRERGRKLFKQSTLLLLAPHYISSLSLLSSSSSLLIPLNLCKLIWNSTDEVCNPLYLCRKMTNGVIPNRQLQIYLKFIVRLQSSTPTFGFEGAWDWHENSLK